MSACATQNIVTSEAEHQRKHSEIQAHAQLVTILLQTFYMRISYGWRQ